MPNRVEIVVGSQDNSKLDLESLKHRLTDVGKMIETARVRVAGDKEGEVAVERLALKLAGLGKLAASPKITLTGAARAETDIAAVELALGKMEEKGAAAAAATAAEVDAVGASADRAREKVGSGGSGLSGALSRLGRVLGGTGAVAAGALGIGLAGPLAAAGLAAAAFGAVAIPTLKGVFTATTAVTAANAKFAAAANLVRQSASGSKAVTDAYRQSLAGLNSGQRDAVQLLGNSSVTWQALSKSQQANLVSLSQNKNEMKNLLPAQKQALTALLASKAAWDQLTPAQQRAAAAMQGVKDAFGKVAAAAAPAVLQVTTMAAGMATSLMPALGAFATTGAKVVEAVLKPMGALFSSSFFGSFVTQMSQLAAQVAPMLGQQLAALLKVFMQMFMVAGPSAVQILNLLVPAIVAMASGLVPVVGLVTKVAASVISWLNANHLLIPALIAVGAAIALASGGLTLIIPAIALVVGGIMHLWQTSQKFRDVVTTVFSGVGQVVLTIAGLWLDEMHAMATGFLDAVHFILVGAQAIAKAIDFVMGTHLAGGVTTALRSFDSFKSGVDSAFNHAHGTLEGWKRDLANLPKVLRLEGNISDLTAKLSSAKAQLRDPNLTRTRRAAIEANIARLEAAIARARAQLNAINGTVAVTYVDTVYSSGPGQGSGAGHRGGHPLASGGITGAMGGGPRGNLTLVGEHGAELVTLPPGAMVHSNPDTQRMLSGGGTMQVVLEVRGGQSEFDQFMLRWIKGHVRLLGGRGDGNVQLAFGN